MSKYALGDFLKDINQQKVNLLRKDPESEKDYTPFLVNRNLANFIDCIFYVQDLNIRPYMDKQLQYDYLIHALNTRKRFAKTPKPEYEEDLEIVKSYYQISTERAIEIMDLLDGEDLEFIRNQFNTGGSKS